MRVVATLLVLLFLAGCLAPVADVSIKATPPGLPIPDPMGQDHDHSNPALHDVAWQFQQTGYDKVAGSPATSAGSHALDLKGNWLFVAAYGGDADDAGGLYIYDVTDPLVPKLTGKFNLPGSLGGDRSMEATQDAAFVVLGTEPLTSLGQVNPTPAGIYVIDVQNKASPRVASFTPTPPFGTHSVTVHKINGKDIVFAGASGGKNVYELVRSPVPTLNAIGTRAIGHDAIVEDDALLGVPILYTANGGAGFEAYDVSNPANAKKIMGWNIPDRGNKYYVHQAAARIIDGHRILIMESEDWDDYPSPLWILDATDFSDVRVLGNWSNPGHHAADGLRYSLHNPVFLNNTLVVAHYHGGVWALDLSTPEHWAAPPVVGVFLPHESGTKPTKPGGYNAIEKAFGRGFAVTDAPMTMDVKAGDGVVYVADLHTGLYAIKPTW